MSQKKQRDVSNCHNSKPMSKSMTKSTIGLSILSETPCTLESSSSTKNDDKKCFKNAIKKYSNERQGCFNSKCVKRKLSLRTVDFFMLLVIGLPTHPTFISRALFEGVMAV